MTLRIPSREEIQHLAQTMGFTLSAAETEAYAALMPGVFNLLNSTGATPRTASATHLPGPTAGKSSCSGG